MTNLFKLCEKQRNTSLRALKIKRVIFKKKTPLELKYIIGKIKKKTTLLLSLL